MSSEIGRRIRIRRRELGMSLREVADRIGVREATVQRYESGAIRNLPAGRVKALAAALQCSEQYLLGFPEAPANTEQARRIMRLLAGMGEVDQRRALRILELFAESVIDNS